MCNFASFVLTVDQVFWSDTSDSHEEIIREHQLHPDGALGPNILRVEITPPREGDMSDLSQWVYKVDQDILPKWSSDKDESRAREAMERRFSKEINVGVSLDLSGCTGLKALPDNLKIGVSLYLPTHLKK